MSVNSARVIGNLFPRRIELHGAATERNHAAVHRQIAVFEFSDSVTFRVRCGNG